MQWSHRSSDDQQFTTAQRDRELLARLREGDESALEALMRIYGTQLAAIAFSLLGRNDLTKDVVQDTFVTLWEQRETITIQSSLGGYLARAVRNRSLNLSRHERRQMRLMEDFSMADASASRVAHNTAEQTLDDADFNARLLKALQSVPPQPRQVFLLNWHAGLSYPEIAELLGVTVASTYTLMYRATRRLAQILGQLSQE